MTANPVPNKPAATRRSLLRRALLAVLLVAAAPAALATSPDTPNAAITHHRFAIDGAATDFTVTATTLPFNDDQTERQAGIFYVAYTRDGADAKTRPVTFVFNGGPGASSAYLHLGALGPRMIDIGPAGQLPAPSAALVDNPDHWLDLTDLVFIDPVGTGYSPAQGNSGRRHWGQTEDLASLATFIDRYLSTASRRPSPVYLAGESYGGFRAARLPEVLALKHHVDVAGAFLISPVIEFSLISGDSLALLPDVLRLPSYAAVMLERTGTPTLEALAEAERFALGPYLTALATPRNEARKAEIVREVARFTGVPAAVIARHGGRLPLGVFVKEARRSDKLLSSRYDGSTTGPDPNPDSARARGDALFDPLRAVLTQSMTAYLADLGVRSDLPYTLSSGQVLRQWNWRSGMGGRDGYPSALEALSDTLERNRTFKVAIAHGMTDLVTPYLTSRYVIDHLPASLTNGRVSLSVYPGGHMMYLRAASRAGLKVDARKLYAPAN
jgi:carboxypeptidase C (cathepsin A)